MLAYGMLAAMPDSVLTAIIGAIAGLGGGLISPVFNLIQKVREDRKSEIERKRAQITEWRQLLIDVAREAEGRQYDVAELLQHNAGYLALEPYLAPEFKHAAYGEHRMMTVGDYRPRAIQMLAEGIDQIELSWGLRK